MIPKSEVLLEIININNQQERERVKFLNGERRTKQCWIDIICYSNICFI